MHTAGDAGMEDWGKWKVTAAEYGVSCWCNKDVLKLIVMIVAQLFEYTKNHYIVYFK